MMAASIATGTSAAQCCSKRTLSGPSVPGLTAHSRACRRRVVTAAYPADPSNSWGEQLRPDTCNTDDQDRPGPLSDLDEEWQEFISGRGRYTQPQPMMWDADSLAGNWPASSSSSSSDPSSSSSHGSSSSNRGPEASCSGRYSSSIQSFDDWDAMDADYALPFPCNMPVNEALPMASSSSANNTSNPAAAEAASIHSLAGAAGAEGLWAALQPSRDLVVPADVLGGARSWWQDMREVYVLLFGVGQKDTEGIYSLRAVSEDGLPTETIISFENMDDAVRYAALLEATMEHSPHVCSIPPAELMAFCSDSGYRCRLELEGSLLMPPEYNVHVTDWERSLRLREGKFHVLQEEPDVTTADLQDFSAFTTPAAMASMAGYSLSRDSPFNEQPGEFSASQLDQLKAQLEALLPPTSSTDSYDGEDCVPDS